MNMIIKKVKRVELNCECYRKYTKIKDDFIEYKCSCCNKNYQKMFDENLRMRFVDTYKFSNYDISKFMLLLQKGV